MRPASATRVSVLGEKHLKRLNQLLPGDVSLTGGEEGDGTWPAQVSGKAVGKRRISALAFHRQGLLPAVNCRSAHHSAGVVKMQKNQPFPQSFAHFVPAAIEMRRAG